MRHIAVIDIGKTNAKLLSVDLQTGAETTIARRANAVIPTGPYPHFDIEALWAFVLSALAQLGRQRKIDAISITTHGASAALIDAQGALVLPVLDYEYDGPDRLKDDYAALRPDFSETGSPRLPGGLNIGAQLYWQAQQFPQAFEKAKFILTYPQYWSHRLTGVAASEGTSLGCHTDLWQPFAGCFSSLVPKMGWQDLFPPLRPASAILGTLLPKIAAATGLPAGTPVLSGIHDSNASLVPWLEDDTPRAVLSTGTWMIVMALGAPQRDLDGARDVLVNVNAKGAPVPTARFMAGREFDEITEGRAVPPSEAEQTAILSRRIMAMPSRHPDTGPFPGQTFEWSPGAPTTPGLCTAAASFYVALMGAECLDLIAATGDVIVEGPFGGNMAFARMLATATGRTVCLAGQGAGTGLGAAMLAGPLATQRPPMQRVSPETDPRWTEYAAQWQQIVRRRWAGRP